MNKLSTKVLLILSLLMVTLFSSAQETVNSKYIDKKGRPIRYNIIKTNLIGWPLGMVNIAYERKLNKKFSALIELDLFGKPFKSHFIRNNGYIDYNSSGFAVSPELRWYLGRNGSPRGYYLGVYVPIINYNAQIVNFASEKQTVVDNSTGYSTDINVQSKGSVSPEFTFRGIGLSGGPQFLIGNRIALEFYFNIAVGAYTLANKHLIESGTASVPLPNSTIPNGNYTGDELVTASNSNLYVDTASEYSYSIDGNAPNQTLTATYTKDHGSTDLDKYSSGLIVLPRIGFSLGYAFGK